MHLYSSKQSIITGYIEHFLSCIISKLCYVCHNFISYILGLDIHIKKFTFAHMRLGKSITRAEIQFIAKHESDT